MAFTSPLFCFVKNLSLLLLMYYLKDKVGGVYLSTLRPIMKICAYLLKTLSSCLIPRMQVLYHIHTILSMDLGISRALLCVDSLPKRLHERVVNFLLAPL